ncbi:MAG: hypothetical protein JXR46_04075 [Calditrichaceae bacterium]|nr:hypothetical protein [Calditrichaceae bacterium]MBN2708204.1 hypothetical protein [Calditrichaceae bacterium]RQV97396.1 MAG: hypothetical protein EH224_01605 [Calditrichota bacterium]
MTLKNVIENNDTKSGRMFDILIQLLIIISLISFSIETLPNLNDGLMQFLRVIEIFTVVIFTFFILIIGLGIVAVPSGLIASALTKTEK